jgi:hypothetical protein
MRTRVMVDRPCSVPLTIKSANATRRKRLDWATRLSDSTELVEVSPRSSLYLPPYINSSHLIAELTDKPEPGFSLPLPWQDAQVKPH